MNADVTQMNAEKCEIELKIGQSCPFEHTAIPSAFSAFICVTSAFICVPKILARITLPSFES
jgi:hypothetical protein